MENCKTSPVRNIKKRSEDLFKLAVQPKYITACRVQPLNGDKFKAIYTYDINTLLKSVTQNIQELWDNMKIVSQNVVPVSFKELGTTNFFYIEYAVWLKLSDHKEFCAALPEKLQTMETEHVKLQTAFESRLDRLDQAIEEYRTAITIVENQFANEMAVLIKNYFWPSDYLMAVATKKLDKVINCLEDLKQVVVLYMNRRAGWALYFISENHYHEPLPSLI